MSTLTQLALGVMGRLRPAPPQGAGAAITAALGLTHVRQLVLSQTVACPER